MHFNTYIVRICFLAIEAVATISTTERRSIVRSFNPHRNASSNKTPLQVGNGNFAFGADISGLQTFHPFAIQSTWGWHNFSLPTTPGQTSPSGSFFPSPLRITIEFQLSPPTTADFTGLDYWTHGRLVEYDIQNPAENDISNWLVQNPQRLNLARIGLHFHDNNVTEDDLLNKSQDLDLWTGTILSTFKYMGSKVAVKVASHPGEPMIGIEVKSDLLVSGELGIFFDFPYSDTNKFDDPYVGVWNVTSNNTVQGHTHANGVVFNHTLDSNVNLIAAKWDGKGVISGPLVTTNRFVLTPSGSDTIHLVTTFPETHNPSTEFNLEEIPSFQQILTESEVWWLKYWTSGAFIDLSATQNSSAQELQRRIILSQYLVAVNEASDNPPQGMH